MAGEALDVFISYSHRDEGLKDELVNYHLKLLQREGKINTWQDRNIEAGAEWAGEIRLNLEKADIVLLLITRHFLASDYCYEKEMQRAVQRHYEEKTRVIPIILKPCTWEESPFSQLQVLPQDGKPVTRWDDRDEAFVNVEKGIRRMVDALNTERRQAEEAARLQLEEERQREREAERRQQQQEAEAQLERERQAAEQLRCQQEAERLQREAEAEREGQHQVEAQRIEQERQEQEAQKRDEVNPEAINDQDPSSEVVGEPVIANDGPSESVEQNPLIDQMTMWEILLNRRSTLWWLAGGIGGLLFWGATSGNGASQTNSRPSGESPPSSPDNGRDSDNRPENTPSPDDSGKALKLQTFSFPVVTLNAQGQEVNRVQKENKYFVEDLGQGISLDMVAIPGGSFLMGSPGNEGWNDEKPQHRVTVRPFFMGKFPVTQAQWRAVAAMPKVERELKSDPSSFKGANRPVERVYWDDAVEFCQRLSRHTNRHYRLPSEAEWEYAYRADTTTPFHLGPTISTDFVNCKQNLGMAILTVLAGATSAVGTFGVANAFGLYDVHGNVWEWCQDVWHGNYEGAPANGSAWLEGGNQERRVLRGGSWYCVPEGCRSAIRLWFAPDFTNNYVGFRVLCGGA
jgi:formylglycine-generating enzyme required for sulfatase activity